jgi:hypothetical protein
MPLDMHRVSVFLVFALAVFPGISHSQVQHDSINNSTTGKDNIFVSIYY